MYLCMHYLLKDKIKYQIGIIIYICSIISKSEHYIQKSLSISTHTIWNTLPLKLRLATTTIIFKILFTIYLYDIVSIDSK